MKKKIFGILLLSIFAVTTVSAVLVSYLSNSIEMNFNVDAPLSLVEIETDFTSIDVAGSDDFALIKLVNNDNQPVTGDFVMTVSPDAEGVYIALTEDINYCFSDQGDKTGVTNCEIDYMTWMQQNIDWNDWYADGEYNETRYPSPYVVNTGGDSFNSAGGYVGNTLTFPDLTIPEGETVYAVMYVATSKYLQPGAYTITAQMI